MTGIIEFLLLGKEHHKRANKARKLVKELIEDGGEKDDKNNSSNADSK